MPRGVEGTMATASYEHGASATPLSGETLGEALRRTVERFGEREALVVRHQGYRATYRELWEQVGVAARGLLAHGVQRGDRIGIWAPNRYEWVIVAHAAVRVGAILVNVNPAYKASELEYALNQSGLGLLILSRGFRQTSYVEILAEIRPRCPKLREALVLEDDWKRLLADGARIDEAALAEREATLEFDNPISIQYTSGTTGAPKGATLSHHGLVNNASGINTLLHYTEQDRVCVPVPFYHCFGHVGGILCCAAAGACMVVPSEAFDPLAVLEAVHEERCTSLYGVPTMFIAELSQPRFAEFDLTSLRTGIMAGAPCPVEIMKRVDAEMHMREVAIAYGMTETSPVLTLTRVDDTLERRVTTVGRAFPHIEVKIVDPATGATVPRGVPGEVCGRGFGVMLGYWENPEATANAIDPARWMHTGDLGTMDEEGYVNIVGRIKDIIIRGGENISPREIEEYLYTHPDIAEVQVIGVPSERYGEEVMAWIQLRPGASVADDDLAAFCHGKIATFKIPRHWKRVDTFPMTVTGKIQKFRMREIAIEELRLEQAAAVVTA
jgi:fatty-acyl-CoA synthase